MWWSKDHRRLANPDDASGVLSFFPLEHVINFTALSEKALLYIEDDFAHKCCQWARPSKASNKSFRTCAPFCSQSQRSRVVRP